MSLTPPNNLSAVSLTPVNSFSAVSLTPANNFRLFGYFPVTRIKFAGVIDTADTGDKYSFSNISANFRKNSKWPQWNTWGPGGHWFMQKTWSRKSRVRLPLNRYMGEAGGALTIEIAQTIGLNCSMTHSPGKIEYNCRYFIMTFRTEIHTKKNSVKIVFVLYSGTMSHRPLTNTSSLKITAAYPPKVRIFLNFWKKI